MVAWLVAETVAQACSLRLDTLSQATTSSDVSAPLAAEVSTWSVIRGHEPPVTGATAESCEEVGIVDLTMVRADEDPDVDDKVGYLPLLVSGDLPEGMELPTEALTGPVVRLLWDDGAIADQDAFSFELALASVDLAGNVGGASETVLIEDDGGTALGCDASGGAGTGRLALAAVTLALFRRRSRHP